MSAAPKTVDDLLREARAGLRRRTPLQAHRDTEAGALLIDIRGDHQRERDGTIPGAHFVPRNVFEWRCDPRSPWRDPVVTEPPGRRLLVICDEGYQSSFTAATLVQFGFLDAGDVIGGCQAWREAGLPVLPWRHDLADLARARAGHLADADRSLGAIQRRVRAGEH